MRLRPKPHRVWLHCDMCGKPAKWRDRFFGSACVLGEALCDECEAEFLARCKPQSHCGYPHSATEGSEQEAALGATATSDTSMQMPPRREYEADLEVMPCGLPRSATVSLDEGTSYCRQCEEDQ